MTHTNLRYTRRMRIFMVLLISVLASACGKDDKGDAPEAKVADRDKEKSSLGAKSGGVPTSREGQMYLLGQKLSQAAMINGRAAPDVVARTFKTANTVADITLKTRLAPLPAVSGDSAKDTAAGMHYMLDGQGKQLGEKIAIDFGETSAATYELGVKLNMVPVLYIDDPKDKMADSLADVLGRLSTTAKLPDSALGPLIAKLKARAPMDEVIDMALGLNKSLAVAIAEIYEKEPKQ